MDRFSWMTTFARVAETRSFSGAATARGMNQSTVSKHIAALEEHLGVRLIQRSNRTLSLTEEGSEYYRACLLVLDQLEAAEATVGTSGAPRGELRVTLPTVLGSQEVVPHLERFLDENPGLTLNLTMTDRWVDLVGEGIDVGLRVGAPPDNSLVTRRVGNARRVAVASPDYLARTPKLSHPKDLAVHRCISPFRLWSFRARTGEISIPVDGRLLVDSPSAAREAVLAGQGVSLAPVWLYAGDIENGDVEVVLERFEGDPIEINMVYPSRNFVPTRVSRFVDFVIDRLRQSPWIED